MCSMIFKIVITHNFPEGRKPRKQKKETYLLLLAFHPTGTWWQYIAYAPHTTQITHHIHHIPHTTAAVVAYTTVRPGVQTDGEDRRGGMLAGCDSGK